MKQFVRMFGAALLACVALSAVAVASASASTWQPPGTAFNGTGTLLETNGTKSFVATFTLNGGEGPYIKCEESTLTGTTKAPASPTVSIQPSYKKCFTKFGGSWVTATLAPTANWSIEATTFLGPTYSARLHISAVLVKVPAWSCTMSISDQTVNISGANDSGTPPAGTTINPNSAAPVELAYTQSGCAGFGNGKLQYRGASHIPAVYVAP